MARSERHRRSRTTHQDRPFSRSAGPFSRVFDRALSRIPASLLVHRDLLILRKPIDAQPTPTSGYRLVEHPEFSGQALEAHDQLGRGFAEAAIRRRFARGLLFYVLLRGEIPLASTWVVPRGDRFVDEIAVGFPVEEGDVWMRDIYVAPQARGSGVFETLLDHVLAGPFPGGRAIWSAVYTHNPPSLRAHHKYGYRLVARYQVVHVFKRLLLRLRWPPPPPGGSSFAPDRRLAVTGMAYRRFVDERLA